MTYGSTIRKFRKQAGLTQEALAQQIDRCPATVSMYERNLRDIPTSVMVQIATILQVSPGAFFVVEAQSPISVEEHDDASEP